MGTESRLTDEQLAQITGGDPASPLWIAVAVIGRAVESAVRSQYEALLRQAREALDITVRQSGYDMQLTGEELRKAEVALSALNARLGDSKKEGGA